MLLRPSFLNRLLLIVCLTFGLQGLAQPITLNQTMTPAQYVQTVLVGSGVTVSNIKYNGSLAAANTVQNTVASFTNSVGGFPMASGVVMTTGNANISPGPNNFSSEATASGANVTDPDLDALTGSSMFNGAVIEFDFVTPSTSFAFQYIFGSEEYLTFVGTSFNDVFGFFLSGPGIAGPYAGGAINLAVVPGTSTPISINTVNPGLNSAYYFDNPTGNGTAYGSSIEYNGTTVLMSVNYNIQCNQTYHMKFAICNVGDNTYDSGVFVKAGSFTALPDLISAGTNQTVCGSAGTVVNLTGSAGTLNTQWTTSGSGTFANATAQNTTYTLSAADIAAGSVTLTLTGTNPCTGNVVTSTMTINYANPVVTVTPPTATICAGSGASVNLTGTTTANAAIRIPRAFTNNTATAIPNNATGINSIINVTGISPNNLATNAVVSVRVNATHPKSSELTVQLVSPGGTTITLKTGLSGFANTTTGANMTNTVFMMPAATPIASGLPPYTGNFIPVGNLNSLTGAINGNWTLKVIDNASGFWDNTTNGSLVNWTINFTTDNYIQSFAWTPTTNMTNSTTLTPTVSPTTTTTYTLTATDAAGCVRTASSTITVVPTTTPTFNPVGPYCSGATIPALPTTSTNGFTGTWSPAINNTATTTYTFTPTAGQCASTTTLSVTVNPNITPTFAASGPYCSGAAIPALPTTSTNGITGTWSPAINNTATTTYTFTPTAGQCATTTTLTITINPNVTPTFAAVGPYCSGATIPALPTTSTNGVTGTWSPAINNTATTTYTFTPGGGCSPTTTLTITINPNVTPTFAAVGPYCSGATIPALPTTSTNGITGTWSPAINNTATTTYTFTPTAGQCATTTTLTITINPNVTPTFAAVGPYCSGATVPALSTTSTNGITGTWSPAINNTATTTYTFTPTAGQCATTTTLTITINPNVTPTFAASGPYCSGATISALPTTSTNGITGTWSPAINNTATTTYTFTPTAGQCATTTTLTITINPNVTPTFAAVGPYCSGATIPSLPTTSTNGVTGTWSPAINNTATTTYTFTPGGGCSSPVTLSITINPNVTPVFAASGPYCSGATIPALPTTSSNGITGTWAPAINNTATTTYTFTPTAGQCATTTTLTINITAPTTPTFTAVGPYCSGTAIPALPTTSNNAITGTWSPAINNTATTTYTFTPTAGQCATTTTLTITITTPTTPTFTAVGPYCSGATIPGLPTTSINGVTGTWSPAINNTVTTTYTFTPTAGLCANTAALTITITPNTTPTFAAVGPYCSGATIPALPTTSTNAVTGTWSPAINNTATTTYTFTPSAGQCATTTTLTITINSQTTPTFTALANVCQNGTAPTLATTSTNGITGTWSPSTFSTTSAGTFTSTFTPTAGQCATTTTISLTVDPTIVPAFNVIPPYCVNDVPATLQTTSNNGVTGTWSPASISTATAGTTTYTFTPNTGQCSQVVSINVTVGPPATPTFTTIAAFCENTTAPTLPSSSLNGFNGTWSPATVSNTASGTYTFTPNAGQCATNATMSITVTPRVTPTFTAVGPYCSGSAIPALPTTSNNGITGTWSPAIDNTATTTYTFTPSASECANPTTLTITINAPVTPTFAALANVCQNGTAPTLVNTSTNGITGTWSPNTFTTSTAGTFTSTFTPNAGQCATTTTLSLVVNALPTITVNSPTTCANSPVVLTANGATNYSWTPGTGLSSTSGSPVTATVATNQTYTVIGTDNNGCSSSAQSTVTIAAGLSLSVTPTSPSICLGSSVSLTASGAVNYAWTPSGTLSASTGATVTASPTATTTYTVNGDDGNGCVGSTNVTVTVNNPTPPNFTPSASYCAGSVIPALPTTSLNGISGTWSPAINNSATTTYTFTPTAGQCASTGTLTIAINQPSAVQFNPLTPICVGQTAPLLPATDLSGITGTWSPSTVNNQVSSNYTFTPDAGQCALTGTLVSTIVANPVASFQPSETTLDITSTDVHFFNNSSDADTYSWTFGDGGSSTSTNPDHTYNPTAGEYTITLTATNQFGCTDQTQAIIQIKEDLYIFVPNTFTPDGDENNNTFFPMISGDFDPQNYTMYIFNRWGETIFESHDVDFGWDGTYHGEYVAEGTYIWTIDLKLKSNDVKKTYNGHVNIFR